MERNTTIVSYAINNGFDSHLPALCYFPPELNLCRLSKNGKGLTSDDSEDGLFMKASECSCDNCKAIVRKQNGSELRKRAKKLKVKIHEQYMQDISDLNLIIAFPQRPSSKDELLKVEAKQHGI